MENSNSRRWLVSLAAALCMCQIGVCAKAAASDKPSVESPAEVASLIANLGDPVFAVREAATTRLAEMDVSVRSALQDAAKSRDAEVRSRARRILAVVNERYFKQRLAAFAADIEDRQQLDLPGWSRYQAIAGKTCSARDLFVEMQRAEPRILEATESKLDSVNELLADRLREVYQTMQFGGGATVNSSSVAALVFVASDPQLKLNSEVANLIGVLAYPQSSYSALAGPRGEAFKKLLEAWVMRDTDDINLIAQNLSLALNLNLSIGRDLAKAMLKKTDLAPHLTQQAMSLLARASKKEDAALLERFLKEEGVLAHYNPNEAERDVLKVCDYAMAMMISLTGSEPKNFRDGPLRWGQGWNADPQTLAFHTNEDRKVALAKWSSWWAEHKDKLDEGKSPTEKPEQKQ